MNAKVDGEFNIRDMRETDISEVMEIAKEVGWHMGVQNVYTWYKIDPLGFKVAETSSGKVVGLCSAVRCSEDFHFVGFYAVKQDYRGKGIGQQVWKSCMQYIGDRNGGLNSTPSMTNIYSKSGFSVIDSECLLQTFDTLDEIKIKNLSDIVPKEINIVSFHEHHFPFIFEYDYKISGYDRKRAIELRCLEKNSETMVAFNGDVCVGFITTQHSILNVPHVSPLYADNPSIAEALLKRMLLSYPIKKGFSMLAFSNNKAACELMEKIDCPSTGQWIRLYKRSADNFRSEIPKVFGHFDIDYTPI